MLGDDGIARQGSMISWGHLCGAWMCRRLPAKHPPNSILDIVINLLLGVPRTMSETSTFGPMQMATVVTIVSAVLAFGSTFAPSARAQIIAGSARPMITRPVVEANLLKLFGNTRPEVAAASDRGRVADNLAMEHLLLQLRRPP